jgi:hypothetical protein
MCLIIIVIVKISNGSIKTLKKMYLCFLERTINEFPFLGFKKGKDALEK